MSKNALLLLCVICSLKYSQGEIYAINFNSQFDFEEFEDAPATFGPNLPERGVTGLLVEAYPRDGCQYVEPPPTIRNPVKNWILLVPRFTNEVNCSFEMKVRVAQAANYSALIVHNVNSNQLVPMYAANETGIHIPAVFVGERAGLRLRDYFARASYFIVINSASPFNIKTHVLIPFAIVVSVCFTVMIVFMVIKCIKDRRRQRRHRLPTSSLNKIPTRKYQKGDAYDTCAICLDDFIEGEKLRVLPCNHTYHCKCIDPWLTKNRRVCPICKRKVFAENERRHDDSDSDTDTDDTTPLIGSSGRGTQGGTFVPQRENPLRRAIRSISQQSNATNFVMASDHHSINGEYHETESSDASSSSRPGVESSTTGSESYIDSLEVQVHHNSFDGGSDRRVNV